MIKGFYKAFSINTHTHTQAENYQITEVHLINSFNIENNLDFTGPLLWMSSLKFNFHFSFSYNLTWNFIGWELIKTNAMLYWNPIKEAENVYICINLLELCTITDWYDIHNDHLLNGRINEDLMFIPANVIA